MARRRWLRRGLEPRPLVVLLKGPRSNPCGEQSYFMGCWHEEEACWQLVCKVANGFSDKVRKARIEPRLLTQKACEVGKVYL